MMWRRLCSAGAATPAAGNGHGMVTQWAAAQRLSLSLLNASLLTTLAPKHFTDSQWLSPTGIIGSLWKGLSTAEREETKLWKILSLISGGQFEHLVFPCISHFVCPDYGSPASRHRTECSSDPSSHKLDIPQTETSSPGPGNLYKFWVKPLS